MNSNFFLHFSRFIDSRAHLILFQNFHLIKSDIKLDKNRKLFTYSLTAFLYNMDILIYTLRKTKTKNNLFFYIRIYSLRKVS